MQERTAKYSHPAVKVKVTLEHATKAPEGE